MKNNIVENLAQTFYVMLISVFSKQKKDLNPLKTKNVIAIKGTIVQRQMTISIHTIRYQRFMVETVKQADDTTGIERQHYLTASPSQRLCRGKNIGTRYLHP